MITRHLNLRAVHSFPEYADVPIEVLGYRSSGSNSPKPQLKLHMEGDLTDHFWLDLDRAAKLFVLPVRLWLK